MLVTWFGASTNRDHQRQTYVHRGGFCSHSNGAALGETNGITLQAGNVLLPFEWRGARGEFTVFL